MRSARFWGWVFVAAVICLLLSQVLRKSLSDDWPIYGSCWSCMHGCSKEANEHLCGGKPADVTKHAMIGWLPNRAEWLPLHIEFNSKEECELAARAFRAADARVDCMAVRPNEQYTLPAVGWSCPPEWQLAGLCQDVYHRRPDICADCGHGWRSE